MGFFDGVTKEKQIDENYEFVIKDKFTYFMGSHEQLYLVDKQDIVHHIWDYRNIKNVYIYKSSSIGDKIRLRKMKDTLHGGYCQVLENITKNPFLEKVNVLDSNGGING